MLYDVIIIGSGVTGAFIARELSRYQMHTCIVEKESDICMGTSKANSAIIHAGYDAVPGSLKARLNVTGNEMMEMACRELDVPFQRIGSLVLAFSESEREKLVDLYERGVRNGVKGMSIISDSEIKQMVPNVSSEAAYALYASSAGIVCPYELTIGAVENAVENGVELKLDSEVKQVRFEHSQFVVSTGKEDLRCRYLVNACGLYADTISSMVGDDSFVIKPRKGEYILLDKSQGCMVGKVIFQLPSHRGKGILVTPTVDGNLLIGPSAQEVDDREDKSTSASVMEQIIRGARKSVPNFNTRELVTSFSGLRAAASTGDFIIEPSRVNKKFIHVAGIESPGLTAAPAIGKYTVEILKEQGLTLVEKTDFNPLRKPVKRFRELGMEELNQLIRKDPRYGKIVCRCERVTEGEIVDCINRPAGARDVDGVKRRTRAGMGRCQGGFCTPRVVEILARELGIPMEDVTKSGRKSKILMSKTK